MNYLGIEIYQHLPSVVKGVSEEMDSLGAWLAQSAECATLDLRVTSLSPTLGMEPT